MNLVEQIFEQAKAGSANGQGFGQFFAEGVNAGQRQQSLNMQKQQLAMELAQAPLKQTLLRQDSEMNALKIQNGLKARQDELEATGAFTSLSSRVSPLLNTGKLDDAVLAYTDAGLNNNVLLIDPRYKALGSQLDLMQKEADLVASRKAIVDERMARDKYNPTLRLANDTADLKAQLRASESATSKIAEVTPELTDELERQQQLKDKIAVMDAKTNTGGATPQVQVIDGKKFLVNSKTGAVHEISKTISKREFIAQHISSWMRDNLWTPDQASKELSDFYDKNLAGDTPTPSTTTVRVRKPDGTIGTIPASRLDEALKAGWKRAE